MVYSF